MIVSFNLDWHTLKNFYFLRLCKWFVEKANEYENFDVPNEVLKNKTIKNFLQYVTVESTRQIAATNITLSRFHLFQTLLLLDYLN